MYVLRVYLRTGLVFDFNYEDLATGSAALESVTNARTTTEPVQVLDDAGRQIRFSGADVVAEGLTDVVTEMASVTGLGAVMSRAVEEARLRLGIDVQVQQQHAAASTGVGLQEVEPSAHEGRRHARFSA